MYREQPEPTCPRCGVELTVYPDRAKWRCPACNGVLLGREELDQEIATLIKVGKRSELPGNAALSCPLCRGELTPTTIVGIDVDRCTNDGAIWFDRGELGQVRASRLPEVDALLRKLRSKK